VCKIISTNICLAVVSGDNEEWMLAADAVVELMALLRQQGDLTAEFFLHCLEVYQSICMPIAVFIMAIITIDVKKTLKFILET